MKLLGHERIHWKKDIFLIFLLGISSGFPLVLCFGTLTAWLTEVGIKKETIGLFGALTFPYTLKFLWSPFFDALNVPFLSKALGQRRAWIIVTQIFLGIGIIILGSTKPEVNPWGTAFMAFVVSFLSASQDINTDAYRIEVFTKEEYGQSSAAIVLGYRVGMLLSGAGALYIADGGVNWHQVYYIMSSLVLVGIVSVLLGNRPVEVADKFIPKNKFKHFVIEPFTAFAQMRGWVFFLLIVILYKIPDAALGSLANNFYLTIGFTKSEIATISKLFGFGATLVGAFFGGYLVSKWGLYRSLIFGCLIQALTVLFFSTLAVTGKSNLVLTLVIGFENLGSGIGDICIVVFISNLCNKQFTATQLGLLSSLSSLGRTFLRAPSGYIAAATGWFWFFVVCAVTAIPCLVIIVLAKKYIKSLSNGVDIEKLPA